MAPQAGEYKSFVGVENLYIAKVLQDDAAGYLADTPIKLAPLAEIGQTVEQGNEVQYADNVPFDSASGEGPTNLTITITGIPAEYEALITGKQFDAVTGRLFDTPASPPDFALGFEAEKSNGKKVFIWFLKGKFQIPNASLATKTDTPAFQTTELNYSGVFTTYEGFTVATDTTDRAKRVKGDEDTANFSGTGWFSQVQTPGASAPSALALSTSDPADGATPVAVDKTITLTFNNRLTDDAIHNVVVVKADGTPVACTNSLDATKKIVTINPDSNLSAGTTFIVAYGVTDIYGQALTGAVNFATA